jgi:hypothetical protein
MQKDNNMTVIEFGKRFSPSVRFDETDNTLSINQEPRVVTSPKELTPLQQNIETIQALSNILGMLLKTATIDSASKRLLQIARSIAFSQEIANKISESVQTNNEPERA